LIFPVSFKEQRNPLFSSFRSSVTLFVKRIRDTRAVILLALPLQDSPFLFFFLPGFVLPPVSRFPPFPPSSSSLFLTLFAFFLYPGMYNVPSFTLARAVGGFINWYCLAAPSRAAPSPSASSFASPHTAQSGVPQSDPPRPRHQPSPSGSNASGSGSGSGGGGGGGGGGSGSSGESSSSRDAHPNGGDSSSSSSSSSKNNENNGDVGSATVDGDGDGDGDTNVFGSSDTETRLIVLASGLILGEGVFSIVNLVLASLGVPHL
jgi:hypothetical protein